MKDLIKNPNVLMIGAGVLAFFVSKMILNKMNKEKSSFDGDGVTNFEPTSGFDYFEPSSEIGGCGCGA